MGRPWNEIIGSDIIDLDQEFIAMQDSPDIALKN